VVSHASRFSFAGSNGFLSHEPQQTSKATTTIVPCLIPESFLFQSNRRPKIAKEAISVELIVFFARYRNCWNGRRPPCQREKDRRGIIMDVSPSSSSTTSNDDNNRQHHHLPPPQSWRIGQIVDVQPRTWAG
jgi:hypothetical protein